MFGIGGGELLLLAIIVLLVYGPERLPEFARAFGKAMRDVRRVGDEVRNAFSQEVEKKPPSESSDG